MSEFGVPGIGSARWNILRDKGIPDREAFRRASRTKIQDIGNPHIFKAWMMDQQRIGKSARGSELDAAKARCELDLAEQTRRAIGELNQPIELLPDEAVPASCTQEVRTLLIHDQQYHAWREYIATEVEHARKVQRQQQLERAPRAGVGVGVGVLPEKQPAFYLVSTDNHMFFAHRENFDKLFPDRTHAEHFLSTSDQVGALLQALTNNRELPGPELLASISEQLLAMATKYNMPFLRFLAEEYDLYEPKSFLLSHVFDGVNPPETTKPESIAYFIQHNIQPVAADLQGYITTLARSGNPSADSVAALWIQALRMPRDKRTATIGALNGLPATQWFPVFADKLKQDALRRRTQDTFENLFAAHTLATGGPTLAEAGKPTQVDAEWAKIILDEHVPFAVVRELGFTFGDDVKPFLEPVYDKARQSLDSPSSVTEFLDSFPTELVRRHVLRAGHLNTEEEKLWAVDLILLDLQLAPLLGPQAEVQALLVNLLGPP